ncbi:lipoxygenase [Tirmania nivea]|nr:lipoxygenase [Tirmania nivea]
MSQWNTGVLSCQLLQWKVTPKYHDITPLIGEPSDIVHGTPRLGLGKGLKIIRKIKDFYSAWPEDVKSCIAESTYQNTQMALSEVFKLCLHKYDSYLDLIQVEPFLPVSLSVIERRKLYTWSDASGYPPHLAIVPPEEKYKDLFNASRLAGVQSILANVIPKELVDLDPSRGTTLSENTMHNQGLVKEGKNIYINPNVGTRATPRPPGVPLKQHWYTDFVFAQQFFTGTNPTTIRLATNEWINRFRATAERQGKDDMVKLIDEATGAKSLYVLDYSDFRTMAGAQPNEIFTSNTALHEPTTPKDRWAVAPVCLFNLPATDGILHPIAIVIDYIMDMASSVVIFNQRLNSSVTSIDEATDWPWRYAKTCIQVADWHKHELGVHLSLTHLVEEAIIVAAHRSFDDNHPVYRILKPHWLKTLAINEAARAILVPTVIYMISGMKPAHIVKIVSAEYNNFNFIKRYIPNDLPDRGFPLDKVGLGDKQFHNYAYARNMICMWYTLRKFVTTFLSAFPELDSDEKIAKDSNIRLWVKELHESGKLTTFPDIKTREQLIDAVTMCIHIASPQHTAVNYLQEYYQTFVINKPPSLFATPPTTLEALKTLTEADLVKALPMNQLRQWLLAAQLPHLLSETVARKESLPHYALTLIQTAAEEKVKKAATELYVDLGMLDEVFEQFSDDMDLETGGYHVMKPEATAVSVLI